MPTLRGVAPAAVTSAAAETTWAFPAETQPGDLLLLSAGSTYGLSAAGESALVSAGWTVLRSTSTSGSSAYHVYKFATSADVTAGSVTVAHTGGDNRSGAVWAFADAGMPSEVWFAHYTGLVSSATSSAFSTVDDVMVYQHFIRSNVSAIGVGRGVQVYRRTSSFAAELRHEAGPLSNVTVSFSRSGQGFAGGGDQSVIRIPTATAPGAISATLSASAPAVSGSFAATASALPVSAALSGVAPGVDALFEAALEGAITGRMVGVAPAVSGDFAAYVDASTVAPIVETSEQYANDGYNYDGTAAVYFEPSIAEPPAHIRRAKVMQVHQSMSAPVLVNGRPT